MPDCKTKVLLREGPHSDSVCVEARPATPPTLQQHNQSMAQTTGARKYRDRFMLSPTGRMMAQGICTVLLAIILEFAGALALRAQGVLPRPETPFKDVIKRTAKNSIPDFPKGRRSSAGAAWEFMNAGPTPYTASWRAAGSNPAGITQPTISTLSRSTSSGNFRSLGSHT